MRLSPLPLGRIGRIRANLDPALVFGLAYLGWWFYERYGTLERLGNAGEIRFPPAFWATALTAGALLGILAHELGHVLFARLAGGRVRELTVSLLGSRMSVGGGRGIELAAALGGPAASIVLGVLLLVVHELVPATHADVPLAVLDLARLQLLYGAVNLLPVPPLDGALFLDPPVARKVGICGAAALVLAALATSHLPLLFAAVYLYAGTDAPRPAPAALSTRPV
jgi:Zn-dependent protease